MLDKIIHFSIHNKLIIILFTLSVCVFGIFSVLNIPVGAVPDITNNQVQVITVSSNLSTQDIEQFITAPVELEMANLPGVKEIRSISKFGLSVVTIVFNDNLGTYLPRQLIAEKIKSAAAKIPEGFGTPEMGPITTGLGEIYQYILDVKPGYENRYSPMELRTIQDWVVKRQLSGIPGVVEINTWGGFLKQYEVAVNPEKLKNFGITFQEVYEAVSLNNNIAGGAYIEKRSQSYFIRGDGMVKSLEDIGLIVVKNVNGIPVLVKDLASVNYGHANRFGAITANGEGEKVLGQIMMLKNANSKKVIREVKKRVDEVQKTLPEGVFINPIVERSELIAKTTFTVTENLVLGCLIVMLTVILILGNMRSALVIASMIPLSLLFTLSMMYIFGIDANLMSLGALDFGIIIDGAVIIVEYIAIRITASKNELEGVDRNSRQSLFDSITFSGASKMMNSAIFGQVIILIVFIPILSLSGVEGKMFRPMAIAFCFALLGAMIFGMTWLPVAASLFIKPEKKEANRVSQWIMKLIYASYLPVIKWSYDHKKTIFSMAAGSLILVGILFSRMGGEFVPTLDEGDFVIQPVLKTGTSLSSTIALTTQMESILKTSFPEVSQIVCRIGAAEVPTDPMSMEEIDMIIKLNPKKTWVSAKSKEELAEKFKEALSVIPGVEYEFTQPIEMRFNELITGVRADIAIKLFGEDLEYLAKKAAEIKKLAEKVPGAGDVILEKTEGLPQMAVNYNRQKIAWYGLNTAMLNSVLTMAFGGEAAGSVFEGERRFDLVVRLNKDFRKDLEDIRHLSVSLPNGGQVPFYELADIYYTDGPAKISRDNTHRRVVVSVNVRGRDLQSVIEDIQASIDKNLQLEPGYYVAYGGQFENLKNATNRLVFAVPVALALIFIFLHFAFKSFKDAVMIFSAVPLSAVGGVLALWIRGMPFSISAGIGFIALFGVAVLNGIVLIEYLKELKHLGITNMRELILKATTERLRPVLLTASSAALGFLPMAVSTLAGAEVQRPLATVVIGGLITSTLLTMIALPLLFSVFDSIEGFRIWPPGWRRTKMLVLIPALTLVSASAFGQGRAISLEEAISITLQNNEELKIGKLKVDQSKALLSSAFSIDKTSVYYSYDGNNIAANEHPLHVFGIAQSMEFPTVYSSQRKLQKIHINIAGYELEHYQMRTIKSITQQYYQILYLQNKIEKVAFIDSIFNRLSSTSEIGFKTGEISYLELLTARSKQEMAAKQKAELNYELEKAYLQFKILIHYDSAFYIPYAELKEIPSAPSSPEINPGVVLMNEHLQLGEAQLRVEKNKLLPDITFGYFNGTNRYPGAKNYSGYEAGLGIPLFFGQNKARIRELKIGQEINRYHLDNFRQHLNSKHAELKVEIAGRKSALDYYYNSGEKLSREMIRMARLSFEKGEIDLFSYLMTLENAIQIEIDYLDNLSDYNFNVIELNYLTLE